MSAIASSRQTVLKSGEKISFQIADCQFYQIAGGNVRRTLVRFTFHYIQPLLSRFWPKFGRFWPKFGHFEARIFFG
jgi:hypothetical protein